MLPVSINSFVVAVGIILLPGTVNYIDGADLKECLDISTMEEYEERMKSFISSLISKHNAKTQKAIERLRAEFNLTTEPEAKWGEWGEWSPCDKATCHNSSRERKCFAQTGELLEPSHCHKIGDEKNIEEKQCCEVPAEAKWGDWGTWSPCDDTICHISHRERKCFAQSGETLEPSHCRKSGDEKNIEAMQCCKELQGINKKKFYEEMLTNDEPLPDAFIKATGSNIKLHQRKELSWVVSLKFQENVNFVHNCGGVILSNKWIVTAAHCICQRGRKCCNEKNEVTCKLDRWLITAGDWRLTPRSDIEQNRKVADIIVHENYSTSIAETQIMDIALIRLKTSLEFIDKPFVQPSLLPARGCVETNSAGECIQTQIDWADRTGCFTTGWGLRPKDDALVEKGRKIDVQVNTDAKRTRNGRIINTESIGVKTPVCEGYSGGPLMCDINKTPLLFAPPQDSVVLGINSFVDPSACTKQSRNHTHASLIYNMEWIANTVMGWSQWGDWSKCFKGERKRFRLRSGFFPEYGYLPSDGPLYQSYHGDQLQSEERTCEVSCKDVTKKNIQAELRNIVDGENQIATQKSTQQKFGISSKAENAIDGHTNGFHKRGAKYPCAHSDAKDTEPWWMVDLGSSFHISGVEIWNRVDRCCREHLRNYSILVTDELKNGKQEDSDWQLCAQHPGKPVSTQVTLCCQTPMQGRYLKLQMHDKKATLMLCEIKIFGGTDSSADCLCYIKNEET